MLHRPLHIFISHSSDDLPFVERIAYDLCTTLRNSQVVWYDTSDMFGRATQWPTVLAELDRCTSFLVVCSPHAMASNRVGDEINIAWQRKNADPHFYLIPLLYQSCRLRADLNTLHYISFLESALYQESFQKLLDALNITALAQETELREVRTPSRRNMLIGAGTFLLVAGGSAVAYTFRQSLLTPNRPGSGTPTPTTPATQPTLKIQNAFAESISLLAWSPVTNTLAAGTSVTVGYVALWQIESGQQAVSQPHAYASLALGQGAEMAWSADGLMLALGSDYKGAIHVYKKDLTGLAAGFTEDFSRVSYPSIQSFCWAPGAYIFSLVVDSTTAPVEGNLHTYDPRHPEQQLSTIALGHVSLDPTGYINPILATSPDASMLAIGLNASVVIGDIHVADTQVMWVPYPALPIEQDLTVALVWSPDSRYLAALTYQTENTLYIWDRKQQFQLLTSALDQSELQGNPTVLAWSPNPTKPWLAIGGANGRVGLWHVGAGIKPVQIFPGIPNQIAALAWSHDGTWLAASYEDASRSILLWRIGDFHG